MNLLIQCIKNQHYDTALKLIRVALVTQLNARDESGFAALHWATQQGAHDIVESLLLKGANPNLSCVKGQSPLHLAALAGDRKMAQMLLTKGASPHALDLHYYAPWMLAHQQGFHDLAQWMQSLPKVPKSTPYAKSDNHRSLDDLIKFKLLEMKNSTPESKALRSRFMRHASSDNITFFYAFRKKKDLQRAL